MTLGAATHEHLWAKRARIREAGRKKIRRDFSPQLLSTPPCTFHGKGDGKTAITPELLKESQASYHRYEIFLFKFWSVDSRWLWELQYSLQESTSNLVLMYKQKEEKNQEEEGGRRVEGVTSQTWPWRMPLISSLQHHEISYVVWLPMALRDGICRILLCAQFTARCTDSQTPRKKRAPRCCCLAAVAQCPHHCPALACWSGCRWCCCCVFEFHCLYYIQGWIRQPGKTKELYMPQIKTAGLGWQLPARQYYQNSIPVPTQSVPHGTCRIWSHTVLAPGHYTVLLFQLWSPGQLLADLTLRSERQEHWLQEMWCWTWRPPSLLPTSSCNDKTGCSQAAGQPQAACCSEYNLARSQSAFCFLLLYLFFPSLKMFILFYLFGNLYLLLVFPVPTLDVISLVKFQGFLVSINTSSSLIFHFSLCTSHLYTALKLLSLPPHKEVSCATSGNNRDLMFRITMKGA